MNPVIHREFFGIMRNPKSQAVLVALSVVFSLMVLFRWPTDAKVDLSGTQSQMVFQTFGYGLMMGVLFLVPSFPAASIVREKKAGTLALLLNSPMKPWSIYFGKFAGVLLFTFLLFLTSVPAAMACYAMGGLQLVDSLGLLYAVLLMMAIQYITLGLLVSTFVQSTDAAVRITYALVFAMSLLAMAPHYFFRGGTGLLSIVSEWLRQVSPVPLVMQIVGHEGVGSLGLLGSNESAARFFAVGSIVSIGFVIATMSRLNYRIFDRSRSKGVITEERSMPGRAVRRLVFLMRSPTSQVWHSMVLESGYGERVSQPAIRTISLVAAADRDLCCGFADSNTGGHDRDRRLGS